MSTLYVMQHGAVIGRSGERIVVRKGRRVLSDLPALHIEQVIILGNAVLTCPAVDYLLKRGVDVAYLSESGTYRGRLQGPLTDHTALRRQQYRLSREPSFALPLARRWIEAKVLNQLALLKRQPTAPGPTLTSLSQRADQCWQASTLDVLRGIEGAASAAYFQAYAALFPDHWNVRGRSKRPPRDPVNAMLSLGYMLLYANVVSAINVVGLDPYCGFFHQDKRGHVALASDLMEEWRPVLVDSLVLQLVKRKHIKPSSFRNMRGQFKMTREGLEGFLLAFENRMNLSVNHPPTQEQTTYRRCLERQVRSLASAIEHGRGAAYQPFQTR